MDKLKDKINKNYFFEKENMKEMEGELNSFLNDYLPPNGPGTSLGIFLKGDTVLKLNHGFDNIKTKTPITSETLFEMASCTKHFTAAAILLLQQEKALNLDDDIKKWFPELKEYETHRPILVSDLVYMMSGFPLVDLLEDGNSPESTNEDVLQVIVEDEPQFKVGLKNNYSNADYNVLGTLVKRASKSSWSEYITQKIFTPLKMNTARALDKPRDFEFVQGYKKEKGIYKPVRNEIPYMYGDGNIFLTMNDFEKWEKSLVDKTVLNDDLLKLAFTPGKRDSGKENDYAFGWTVDNDEEYGKVVSHEGGWDGTSTCITRYLDVGLTYSFFVNIDEYDIDKFSEKLESILFSYMVEEEL